MLSGEIALTNNRYYYRNTFDLAFSYNLYNDDVICGTQCNLPTSISPQSAEDCRPSNAGPASPTSVALSAR